MVLVDYRCRSCQAAFEAYLAGPIPGTTACPACGEDARRLFSTAGLAGKVAAPASNVDVSCTSNWSVPGLCHVAPSARKALVARYMGDDKTYAAERKKQQETFERQGPPPLASVLGHGCHAATSTSATPQTSGTPEK